MISMCTGTECQAVEPMLMVKPCETTVQNCACMLNIDMYDTYLRLHVYDRTFYNVVPMVCKDKRAQREHVGRYVFLSASWSELFVYDPTTTLTIEFWQSCGRYLSTGESVEQH